MSTARTAKQKQEAFARFYTTPGETFLNGAASARKAGYSARSARVQAATLLAYPNVQALIEKRAREHIKKTDLVTMEFFQKLADAQQFDVRELGDWDEDGNFRLKPSDQISDRAAWMISDITKITLKNGSTKMSVKTLSREKLQDLLGKFLGVFSETRVQATPADQLAEMDRRERNEKIRELLAKRDSVQRS